MKSLLALLVVCQLLLLTLSGCSRDEPAKGSCGVGCKCVERRGQCVCEHPYVNCWACGGESKSYRVTDKGRE